MFDLDPMHKSCFCEIFDERQHVKDLSAVMNKLAYYDDRRNAVAPKQDRKINPDVSGTIVG